MPTLTQPVDHPSAWRATDMADASQWTVHASDAHLAELDALVARAPADIQALDVSDLPLPSLAPVMASLRERLEGGPGFVLLRGFPVERWGEHGSRLALWAMGRHLGEPEPQDGSGSLIHDVRDTGQSFEASNTLREYQTNRAINFHNDGADVFCLMALKTAPQGGETLLASSTAIFNRIVGERPDLAQTLQEDFHADTRGQRVDGAKVQSMSIYHWHAGLLTINYKSNLIHAAQRFPEVPRLSELQREALERLDELCGDPEYCLALRLAPGDVLIANNYATFHGRRKYEDSSNAPRRHLLRLWLTLPNGRELPPVFEGSREYGATYARRMPSGAVSA